MSRRLSLTIFFVDVFLMLWFIFSRWYVQVELKGEQEMSIPFGEAYLEPGASAQILGKDISLLNGELTVTTEGQVNTAVPGDYSVEYRASRLFYRGKTTRTVHVVDAIAPELSLGAVKTELDTGDVWEDDFAAWDNCDGDLTAAVQVTGSVDMTRAGKYPLTYTVTDSSGNVTTAEREVVVYGVAEPVSGKIIFLTYDDGPCDNTQTLLDILDRYNVKATFFVTGNGGANVPLMQTEAEKGHTVAVHTLTHDYNKIYQSQEAYWEDFNGMNDIVESYTGYRSRIFRFPGGSSNTVSYFNPGVMTRLTAQAHELGYEYFDWNVDVSDGVQGDTREAAFQNAIAGIQLYDVSVVLCHDTHMSHVEATEDIIQWGLENGYTFLPLAKGMTVCHHQVNN